MYMYMYDIHVQCTLYDVVHPFDVMYFRHCL